MEGEAVDSTALSGAPSPELDEADVPVDGSIAEPSDSVAAWKVVRKQKLDKKEYTASDLADVLRQRKCKAGHAKYWDQLAVDIVSVEEKDNTETRRYDKVVVRCMRCTGKHDGTTMNVPNFAKTHFDEKNGEFTCKSATKQGAWLHLVTIGCSAPCMTSRACIAVTAGNQMCAAMFLGKVASTAD